MIGWANYLVEHDGLRQVHCLPEADIRPHQLWEMCDCRPREDEEHPGYWAHNAFDQREGYEQGRRLH